MTKAMHILDQECNGLADKLASTPAEVRRRIIAGACILAAKSISDPGPELLALLTEIGLSHSLSASRMKAAENMANEADKRYFALQESGAGEQEWVEWFSKARLLTAITVGFESASWENSADAVYELSKATDHPSDLFAFVMSELRTAEPG